MRIPLLLVITMFYYYIQLKFAIHFGSKIFTNVQVRHCLGYGKNYRHTAKEEFLDLFCYLFFDISIGKM